MSETSQHDKNSGKHFTYFLDGNEKQTTHANLTAGELMDEAGIPRSAGLVEIQEDGTERSIPIAEMLVFEGPGRRFKKAPRFKRG